jgi:hypothetical protein
MTLASMPVSAEVSPSPELRECRADERARPTSTSNVTLPRVGQPSTAEIGSPMISYIREELLDAGLRLTRPIQAEGTWAGAAYIVSIPAGEAVAVETRKGTLFVPRSATFRYAREKAERSGLGKPDIGLIADPTGMRLRISFGLRSTEIPVDGSYEPSRCRRMGDQGFRRELIFGGAAKGVIKLQYREYMAGLARAPFAQELTYDLVEGSEIGFKGARVNVVRVTNTGIEYVVLKPFD